MRQLKRISDNKLAQKIEKIAQERPTKPSQKLLDELLGEENNKNKGENKMEKTNKKLNIETIKTVVIAVLVTGIIAFIAGIKYQQNKQAELERKIDESISTLKQAQ